MDHYTDIEPIHELPSDELEDNLNNALESLKLIWTGTAGVSHDADFHLQTLIYSIKKSLGFFYPDLSTEISEMADAGTALFFRDCWKSHSLLKEGGKAIASLYLQTGATGCEPQEYEAAVEGFHITERQVFKLAEMARHYFHDKWLKDAAPFIRDGKARRKQLHAPKQKKNKSLLQYCKQLLAEKPSHSAAHLLRRIPEKAKAAMVDGATIYREETDDGESKVVCLMPNGGKRVVGSRAFAEYYKEAKII